MKYITRETIAMVIMLCGIALMPHAYGMEIYNSKGHRMPSCKTESTPGKGYPVISSEKMICTRRKEEDLHSFYARITTYWASGGDTDYDSRHHRSATGEYLEEGVSAAVDPSIIPFGSTINIPGFGKRKANDTGSAVISRKASHGKLPIIDVFFDRREDALEYEATRPQVVLVSFNK